MNLTTHTVGVDSEFNDIWTDFRNLSWPSVQLEDKNHDDLASEFLAAA